MVMINILKLNIEKFISDINIDELDKFNKILISEHVEEFLPFILNINNTDKYIKCWLKIIFSNAKKLLNKQEKIIKEVIEDINNLNNYSTEFKITESQVMNFKNYLKENSK